MRNKTLFSQNLRKLREDKKISQKLVSQELGISQALLSHYEKGVRECGLNFLVKAAKYYGVSTDYLLGLADENFCSANAADEDAGGIEKVIKLITDEKDKNVKNEKNESKYNNYPVLCKNLLTNVIEYIFDGMTDAEYKQTAKISGEYMLMSAYLLCKYLAEPTDTGTAFLSLEEITAVKARLITELKNNNKYLKLSEPSGDGKKGNEYIKSMMKTGESIISRMNF